jgi:hypothetical protein
MAPEITPNDDGAHPEILDLGFAPLRIVGLMPTKTSSHCSIHGHPLSILHSVWCAFYSRRGFSNWDHTETDGPARRGFNRLRMCRR